MATSNITKITFIKTLKSKNIELFSFDDIKKLFTFENETTLKHLLKRLLQDQIIERLSKGKYLFLYGKGNVSDFEIANFLVIPSYISLESALSFYGILEQFPYKITSLTLSKPKEINVRNKTFSYSRIRKENFKDFLMKDSFLIAEENKALFDYLYFIYKGLRSVNFLKESTYLKRSSLKSYILKNTDKKFLSFLKKYSFTAYVQERRGLKNI